MTEFRDQTHYEALGVSEAATPEEIRAAFKKIMREYHPDNFRDADKDWVREMADSRSKATNAAHDVLKDPQKRAAYDRKLDEDRQEREREEEERREWEAWRRRQYEEEPAGDPEDAWAAWESSYDTEQEPSDHREGQERAGDEWSAWGEWEASRDAGEEAGNEWTGWEDGREEYVPPPPPARPPPSDLPGLATWTADRIPTPVHLLCGALVSGFGWTLAILLISQQSFAVGALLTLAFLASVPVAGGLLWLNGLSLSRVGMVVVAIGGGLPVLLVASLIPGLNVLLFLGAIAWAVIMLTATYARRNTMRR